MAEQADNSVGESYGSLVWRQFRKRTDAYVALWALFTLFFMAMTAPLVCNNLPWYYNDGTKMESPLLKDFFFPQYYLDRFYNSMLIILMLVAVTRLAARYLPKLPKIGFGISATLFVMLFTICTLVGGKNNTIDFQNERESGKTAVFTVIPYGALQTQPERSGNPPDANNLLGCDGNGFDVLTRIVHGSRISLAVGFLAVGLALGIGVFAGSLAGYFGGWVDIMLSRVIEVFICFPSFFLILTIIAIAPSKSIFWVMFAIGLTGWMNIARLVRGEVLKVRQLDYVQAALALGATNSRIIWRHVLPNAIAPVLVAATFGVAGAILAESGLGFLGLGVEPPNPSWGELLNQARAAPVRLWWLLLFPGFMIFLTVTLMNLAGEGLRDAMDPRLRR